MKNRPSETHVLTRAKPGELVLLGMLTDEQILAVEGLELAQPTVLPWHETQPDPETRIVTAARALFAAGLFIPGSGKDDSRISADMTGILSSRRASPVLLIIERETSESRRWSYSYLFNTAVLEEQVSADGFHTFVALSTSDLGDHLVGLLDPFDTAGNTAELGRFTSIDDFDKDKASFPIVTEAIAVSTMTLLDAQIGQATTIIVFASGTGVAILETQQTPDDANQTYVLRCVSRKDLIELTYHLIADSQLPDIQTGNETAPLNDPPKVI
ncbi:MAG: hypothetical protein LBG99_06570 [Propionibacteriaceae bacterium]|jgi:hypothetical protein|nr:hypothetical protein [Propionibacteriaceae bacterium]